MVSMRARGASLRGWKVFALCALLAGCGGGGGGDSGGGGFSVSGVAATGAPIAGGTVEVKCVGGNGSTTTTSTGGYTLSLTGASLPCVLKVTAPNGTVLHSIAQGTPVANLTPITELVVAALARGTAPALFFSTFDGTNPANVDAGKVAAALAAVVAKLKSAGIDVSALGNLISAALVAANGGTPGNAYDQALDLLKARLTAAGTTLDALTQSIVQEQGLIAEPNAAPTNGGTVSVPLELRLAPAAAQCSALHSGRYRVVGLVPGTTTAVDQASTFDLDATTLRITNDDGSITSLAATGTCQFTETTANVPDPATDIRVSQAGIMVLRSLEQGAQRVLIAFPEQSHPLAAIGGSWNSIAFARLPGASTYQVAAASVSVNATGQTTEILNCQLNTADCTAVNVTATVTANATGGFDGSFTGAGSGDRIFAYRAGGGELMLVSIAPNGSVGFWTRQRDLPLPTLNTPVPSWDYEIDNNLVSTAPADSLSTPISVNNATGQYVRRADLGAGVTRDETLVVNSPRPGYRFRAQANVTNSANVVQTVREQLALPLRGMGVAAIGFRVAPSFMIAIAPPP